MTSDRLKTAEIGIHHGLTVCLVQVRLDATHPGVCARCVAVFLCMRTGRPATPISKKKKKHGVKVV